MRNADVQTILDHITSERQKVENYIGDKLKKINTKLDALQKDVSEIKQTRNELQKNA